MFTVGAAPSSRRKPHGMLVHEGPVGEYLVGRVPTASHDWFGHVRAPFLFGGAEPEVTAKITPELRSDFGE